MARKGIWYSGFEMVSDFRMFYLDWRPAGGADRPPVIALHGASFQSGLWRSTVEAMGGNRFICPDQRGYGRSGYPGGGDTAADFARDAIGLADALMLPRFIVMGHSFAGAISLEIARRVPGRVAAVVLADPSVREARAQKAHAEAARNRQERFDSLAEAARHFRETEERNCSLKTAERFVSDILIHDGNGGPCRMPYARDRILNLRAAQGSPRGGFNPVPKARSVKCPVLWFRGAHSNRSTEAGVRRLRTALPRGTRFVVCPKSGHFPFVSDAAIFRRELGAFLARIK